MVSHSSPRSARRAVPAAALVLLLLVLTAGCGAASGPGTEPALEVTGAWARAANQGDVSAVYFVIENRGKEAVRLTGVRTDVAATAELHRTVQDGSTARMEPVQTLEVPAGEHVELAPGGYHLMLMDLRRDLNPGDAIELTLQFDGGHEVKVTAEVRDGGTTGHTHGN